MNLLPCKNVVIGERTRELDLDHKDQMKQTIRKVGLLSPIVLSDDNGLVAGLHRLHAMMDLHAEGEVILHDGEPIPLDLIPFVRLRDLTPEQLLEAEIAENLYRKELSWQERIDALARLHKTQVAENPSATFHQTAAKLVDATGKNEHSLRNAISRAVVIADAMEKNPSLADCRSEADAFSRIKTDLTRISTNLLGTGFEATQTMHRLLPGDLRAVLPLLDADQFDLSILDLPYGVGADTWTSKFQDAPHAYKDDWKYAAELHAFTFAESFRLSKERANLFAFCDIKFWHLLRDMADSLGWSVWPHPVIWHKSNEGIRPWGQKGYAYCYEAILFAAKGQRGLSKTGPDVITGIYKVRDREHGAAKPSGLYAHLIDSTCLPGDSILDPSCGSGTVFEAATLTSTVATGIELDDHYVGLSQQRITASKKDLIQASAEDFD